MAGDTNFTTDSRKELNVMKEILRILESYMAGHGNREQQRLFRALIPYLNSGQTDSLVMDVKMKDKLEDELTLQAIPHTFVPILEGNYILLTPTKYRQTVQGLATSYYMNETCNSKLLTDEQMLGCLNSVHSPVLEIDLESITDSEIMNIISHDQMQKNNLVANTTAKKDYVISSLSNLSGQRDFATYLFTMSAYATYKELEPDNFNIRIEQAKYDNKIEEKFAKDVFDAESKGKNGTFYISNIDGTKRLEYKNGFITFYNGDHDKSNEFDVSNLKDRKDIIDHISQYTRDIKDMHYFTGDQFRNRGNKNTLNKIIEDDGIRPVSNESFVRNVINTGFEDLLSHMAKELTAEKGYDTYEKKIEYIKTNLRRLIPGEDCISHEHTYYKLFYNHTILPDGITREESRKMYADFLEGVINNLDTFKVKELSSTEMTNILEERIKDRAKEAIKEAENNKNKNSSPKPNDTLIPDKEREI